MNDGRKLKAESWKSPMARLIVAGAVVAVSLTTLAEAQTWRSITTARQLHGENALDVHVQYGAGRFTLAPGAPGTLYKMDMKYDEDRYEPLREYDPGSGTLRLGVRSLDHDGVHVSLGDNRHNREPQTLDLALAPGLPLSLDIEVGATQADLNLGGLAIRSFHYKTGASESLLRFGTPNPTPCDEMEVEVGAASLHAVGLGNANCQRMTFDGGVGSLTLDFSGTWRHSASAEVNVGIGSLHLNIPRDIGVAIRLDRFLASFDQSGFTKRGNTWYSNNFDAARYHLTLDVSATLGGVDVQWLN